MSVYGQTKAEDQPLNQPATDNEPKGGNLMTGETTGIGPVPPNQPGALTPNSTQQALSAIGVSLPNGPAPAASDAVVSSLADALRNASVRQTTHGDFGDNAVFADQARDLLRSMKPGWSNCTAEQRLALDEIMLKIARILSGGNRVSEHWIDIQGYARLGDIPEVKKGKPHA